MISTAWVSANPGYFTTMILILMFCLYALIAIRIMTVGRPPRFFKLSNEVWWIQRSNVEMVYLKQTDVTRDPRLWEVVYCFPGEESTVRSLHESPESAEDELRRFIG